MVILVSALTGCGVHSGVDGTTEVPPLSVEDLGSPCSYEIVLAKPSPTTVQQGVLVIYERGDSASLFQDTNVRETIASLHFALVFAHECDAKSFEGFQSDPTKGPGRALFQALSQFASLTAHPELASASVMLYGFSAAGVLAAEMPTFSPNRVKGTIAYAAGSAQQDLSAFHPSIAALKIPSLFLANSQDPEAGTTRSHTYFAAGRARFAPWAYGVQNNVGHCCNRTTRSVILPWIFAVATAPQTNTMIGAAPTPPTAWFICKPDGQIDAQGDEDCSFTGAALGAPSSRVEEVVWLPSKPSAEEWLAWVTAH